MPPRTRLAYVIDPRFPGGTSSAFARELRLVAGIADVTVHAIKSAMFRGRAMAPQIEAALEETGLTLHWDTTVIAADTVVLHNPVFLKYNAAAPFRIVARHLVVVAHENFLRPNGEAAFDVSHCLGMIERGSLALRRSIAPVSANNRVTVLGWLGQDSRRLWRVLDEDWFNICDFSLGQSTRAPADRRGRHSRPGFEKFPPLDVLDRCFPATAECNVMLGADAHLAEKGLRPHWTLFPFNGIPLQDYFGMIDFMVYFTAATWRESFGRVLAEGIAAGKVVISDAATASTFGGGVIAAKPDEVDDIVTALVRQPDHYRAQVVRGQQALAAFSNGSFTEMIERVRQLPVGADA